MKIELVSYQPQFLQPLFEWRSQPASVKHNPLLPVTIEKLQASLELESSSLQDIENCKKFRWFITVDDEVCGAVTLKEINLMMNFAEIGYQVAETYHGRGIMTGALRLLLDRIFRETSLRRIMAYVHDENIASCRVLEKLGFQKEGLLREHFIINGKAENEFLFALLKSDWLKSNL